MKSGLLLALVVIYSNSVQGRGLPMDLRPNSVGFGETGAVPLGNGNVMIASKEHMRDVWSYNEAIVLSIKAGNPFQACLY
jgi:hypothetical protein